MTNDNPQLDEKLIDSFMSIMVGCFTRHCNIRYTIELGKDIKHHVRELLRGLRQYSPIDDDLVEKILKIMKRELMFYIEPTPELLIKIKTHKLLREGK